MDWTGLLFYYGLTFHSDVCYVQFYRHTIHWVDCLLFDLFFYCWLFWLQQRAQRLKDTHTLLYLFTSEDYPMLEKEPNNKTLDFFCCLSGLANKSTLLSSDEVPSSLILEPKHRDSSGSWGFFRIRTDILELSVITVESEFEPLLMLCLDPRLGIRFCLDLQALAGGLDVWDTSHTRNRIQLKNGPGTSYMLWRLIDKMTT